MKKHLKRKNYFSKFLREEEQKKKRQHHTTSHMLCLQTLLWLKSTKLCEKQLELQQVSLIPFPHQEILFFVNHNSTVAVCLSFMFIVDIVCICRMNVYHCSLLYTTVSVCCKFSTFYTSNIFVGKNSLSCSEVKLLVLHCNTVHSYNECVLIVLQQLCLQ